MSTLIDVFVSSKMRELRDERTAIFGLLPNLKYSDITLHGWVFERDAPASDRPIRDVYLEALQNCALYIGIFGKEYGEWTIDEFDQATDWGIERHIYLKNMGDEERDDKLQAFLKKNEIVTSGITSKWYTTIDDLQNGVKQSISDWIQRRFLIHPGASTGILVSSPESIPEQPERLIGRAAALRTIQALLADKNRLLLRGFGGTGKTALAVTVAVQWIVSGKGSVLWLRVGSNSSDQIYLAMASAFNKQTEIANKDDDSKEAFLRELLNQSEVNLVILDDVWWNRNALSRILRAIPSSITVLATSRQRFVIGNIYDVSDLDATDALQLLSYHANRDLTADPVAIEICKRLSNHAYSIERAGKLLDLNQWSTSQLVKALVKEPFYNLQIPGDYSSRERTSVKTMMDTSLGAMNKRTQAVFLACGHFFAPSITSELLCNYLSDTGMVNDALSELVRYGLLHSIQESPSQNAHYRMHDLAYSYVRAQASDEDHNKAIDSLLAYSNDHKTTTMADIAAVLPELDNLMAAVKYALSVGRYSDVEEIVWNLHTRNQLSQYYGFYDECIALLHQAVAAAAALANREHEGVFLGNIGKLFSLTGRYKQALEYQQQALVTAYAAQDKKGIGIDLSNLGEVYSALGRHERGIDYRKRGLSIIQGVGDKRHESILLRYLGSAYRNAKQFSEALECYLQAWEIAKELHDAHEEHLALVGLGSVNFEAGEYALSLIYNKSALHLAEKIGDRVIRGDLLIDIGRAHLELRQPNEALPNFVDALTAMIDSKRLYGATLALWHIGRTYTLMGQYQDAIENLKQALSLSQKMDDRSLELEIEDSLGFAVYRSQRNA